MNRLKEIIADHETLAGAYWSLANVEIRCADKYKDMPELQQLHLTAAQTLTDFARVLGDFGSGNPAS